MASQVPFLLLIEAIMLAFSGRSTCRNVYEILHINLLNRISHSLDNFLSLQERRREKTHRSHW